MDALRPVLLQIEDAAKPNNPMHAPHLPRQDRPKPLATTYALLLSEGGGRFIPADQPHPVDPTRGKPFDNGADQLRATRQKLEETLETKLNARVDSFEAKIDAFCTSMQASNKRKRDQEEEETDDD